MKVEYDDILDILICSDKKINPKKVDFIELMADGPVYAIVEKDKIVGVEFIGIKKMLKEIKKNDIQV